MSSVAVFWDVDMFPPSFEGPVQNVETLACQYGTMDSIHAYAEDAQTPPMLAACPSILVMDCSQETCKGTMIAVDMFAFAMRTPHPATLIVISDAQMLANAVSILRLRKYRVVVVGSVEGSRGSLKQRASEFKDWDVLVGQRRDGALLDAPEGGKVPQVDAGDDEDSNDGVWSHAPSIEDERPREARAEATVLRPSTPQDEAIEAKAHPTLIEEVSLEEHPPHSPLSIHHAQLSQQPSPASNTIPLDFIPEMQSKTTTEASQPTSPPTPEALAAELVRYRKLIEELSPLPNSSRKRADVIKKLLRCSTFLHTRESLGLSGLDGYTAQGIIDLGERVNADGTMTAWVCLGPSTGAPKGAITEVVSPNTSRVHIPTINPIVTPASLFRTKGATTEVVLPNTSRVYIPSIDPIVTPASLFKMAGAAAGIRVGSITPTAPEDASIVFRGLVDILQPHARLERSHVAGMLLSYIKRDWSTFSRLGISEPDRLFALAASEGLVVFSKTKGMKWIALAPAWRNSTGRTQNAHCNVPLLFGNETIPRSAKRAAVIAQAKATSPSERMFPMAPLVSQGVVSSTIADDVHRPIPSIPSLDIPGPSQVTTQRPSFGLLGSEESESETLSDVTSTPLVVAAPIDSSLRRSPHETTTTYPPHLPRPMAGNLPYTSPINDADLSPIFRALVHILQPHNRLTRTKVASILQDYIQKDNPTLSRRGIEKPRDLFALAASEGVVVLSETIVYGKSEQWIALAPALRTLIESTSTPEVDVSVSLENEANALNEQCDGDSHAAVLDHAAKNADNAVHEPIGTNTRGASSADAQANSSAKHEQEASTTVDIVNSIPPPSTSIIDKALFANLIRLVEQHGPEAERSIIGSGLKASNSSIYTKAGVQNFKEFINLAVAKGLVTLGHGTNPKGKTTDTISLAPNCQNHLPATDALPSTTRAGEEASSGPWEPAFGSFQTLVEEIQRHPVTHPTRSLVYAKLAKDPARHVLDNLEEFDGYIAQAYDAGIIDLGENHHADGTRTEWISLGPTCQHLQDSEKDSYYWPQMDALVQQSGSETTSALPVIQPTARSEGVRLGLVPAGFTTLIAVLRKFKSLGNFSPFCTAVSHDLLQASPLVIQEAGCQTFMEYVHLAEHAGVVLLNETRSGHHIFLV
ncbi:hypothetical protein FIBSPDRAFT_1039518 [Athelia psychrophila]|uniref:NYN domain-containing protein n=1 Tax=Athelia psychrophila TaxID=1759441 RepID=A0A166RKR7_9AGAM|nr:hypothetical protein FIBSPDRAFT_1039518 [Fibularhizoctonia sp. CBS 109695]